MKLIKDNVLYFTDVWEGKNYGCTPKLVNGKTLYDRLSNSEKWIKRLENSDIEEKGDNRCDIFRGCDYSFEHVDNGNFINIFMTRSRSGKTIKWEFHCSFSGSIPF